MQSKPQKPEVGLMATHRVSSFSRQGLKRSSREKEAIKDYNKFSLFFILAASLCYTPSEAGTIFCPHYCILRTCDREEAQKYLPHKMLNEGTEHPDLNL